MTGQCLIDELKDHRDTIVKMQTKDGLVGIRLEEDTMVINEWSEFGGRGKYGPVRYAVVVIKPQES